MALPTPKIPTYTTTLPISNTDVTYRTFLVGEEKIIMLALTSEDPKEMLQAMMQVINLCTGDTLDLDSLPMVDLSFLLAKIRGVSKGNNVDLVLKCKNTVDRDGEEQECGYVNEVSLSLDDLTVKGEIQETNISLYDDVGVIMKPPALSLIKQIDPEASQGEQLIQMVIQSISSIYTSEEVHDEFSDEEAREFLDQLTSDHLGKLMNYINTQPRLKIDIDYTCSGCGVHKIIEVDNIQDFLG